MSGRFIGTVGAFFRETAPGDVELGWTVVRAHWGKGIATEAAHAAAAYAFRSLGASQVYAHIDPRNPASLRVAANIGMSYQGDADFYGEPTGRYVLEPANLGLPTRHFDLA